MWGFLYVLVLISMLKSEKVSMFTSVYDFESTTVLDELFKETELELKDGVGENSLKVKVNTPKKYQSILGFGAALSDSSAYLFNQIKMKDPEMFDRLIDALVNEYRIGALRLTCGSSDYIADRTYWTYQDDESRPMTIDKDKTYYIPVLKEFTKRKKDIVLLSTPWSAPGWMKTSSSLLGGSLLEKYEAEYSKYIIKYLSGYAQELGRGIDFMTIQNEPYCETSYPSMSLDQPSMYELLSIEKTNVNFVSHDHNWDLSTNAIDVINEIFEKTGENETIVAWHAYGGERQAQKEVKAAFPNKKIRNFFTEITAWSEESARSTNLKRDFRWSMQNILIGSIRYDSEIVMYWNLLLNLSDHGPTPRTDSLAYGLITLKDSQKIVIRPEIEFVAVAHFSKFVLSGSKRIDSNAFENGKLLDIDNDTQAEKNLNPDGSLESVAFVEDDGNIVVVVLNPSWTNSKRFDVVFDNEKHVTLGLGTESAATLVFQKSKNLR